MNLYLDESQLKGLQQSINSYLDGHKNRTIATLAKKAGVGQSTLRRIVQGQANNPEFETLIAILKVILSNEELAEFIEKINPDIGNTMRHIYSNTYTRELTADAINRILEDEVSYFVFQLANFKGGTTREDVLRLMGQSALYTLDHMIDTEYLHESGGVITSKRKKFAISNVKTTLKTIQHLISRFDTSLIGTDAATITTLNGSVNHTGLKKIRKIVLKAAEEINTVRDNHTGNIRFYANMFMNLFDKKPFDQNSKH